MAIDRLAFVLLACLGLLSLPDAAFASPVQITITSDLGQSPSLQVGNLITVNVSALDPNDVGIFSFNMNLLSVPGAATAPLQVVSVSTPGADPAYDDPSYPPTGTLTASNPGEVDNIYGFYSSPNAGVGTPQTLFSVIYQAIAIGQVSLAPGPSVTPTGFDLLLNDGATPGGVYPPGLSINVTSSVPEANCVGFAAVCALSCLSARRRARRVRVFSRA